MRTLLLVGIVVLALALTPVLALASNDLCRVGESFGMVNGKAYGVDYDGQRIVYEIAAGVMQSAHRAGLDSQSGQWQLHVAECLTNGPDASLLWTHVAVVCGQGLGDASVTQKVLRHIELYCQ